MHLTTTCICYLGIVALLLMSTAHARPQGSHDQLPEEVNSSGDDWSMVSLITPAEKSTTLSTTDEYRSRYKQKLQNDNLDYSAFSADIVDNFLIKSLSDLNNPKKTLLKPMANVHTTLATLPTMNIRRSTSRPTYLTIKDWGKRLSKKPPRDSAILASHSTKYPSKYQSTELLNKPSRYVSPQMVEARPRPVRKPVVHQIITKWSDRPLYTAVRPSDVFYNYNGPISASGTHAANNVGSLSHYVHETEHYEEIPQISITPKPVIVDNNRVQINNGALQYDNANTNLAQSIFLSTPLPPTIILSSPFPELSSFVSPIETQPSYSQTNSDYIGQYKPTNGNDPDNPDMAYDEDSLVEPGNVNTNIQQDSQDTDQTQPNEEKCPTIHITSITEMNTSSEVQSTKEGCQDLDIVIHSIINHNNVKTQTKRTPVLVTEAVEDSPIEESPVVSDEFLPPGSQNLFTGLQPASNGNAGSIGAQNIRPSGGLPNVPNLPSLSNNRPSQGEDDDDTDADGPFDGITDGVSSIFSWIGLNPFNLGFITSLLSPIAAVAAGGVVLAMVMFPWAVPGLLFARSLNKVHHQQIAHYYPVRTKHHWHWNENYNTWHRKRDPRSIANYDYDVINTITSNIYKYIKDFKNKYTIIPPKSQSNNRAIAKYKHMKQR